MKEGNGQWRFKRDRYPSGKEFLQWRLVVGERVIGMVYTVEVDNPEGDVWLAGASSRKPRDRNSAMHEVISRERRRRTAELKFLTKEAIKLADPSYPCNSIAPKEQPQQDQ